MKDSAEYAWRLKKFLGRLKREGGKVGKEESLEPVSALILGCLSSVTTESKARAALKKFDNIFVDYNELRVCRIEEVTEVLGKGYPQGREVSRQIINLLHQIYSERDNLSITDLKEEGKREAKAFLENLQDITPYVVARVMLQSIGGHSFPVHEQMFKMLGEEEVINPHSDIDDVQGFLERQISASKIHEVYDVLRHHADNYKPKVAKKSTNKKAKSKGAKAKKASKKTASKKKDS